MSAHARLFSLCQLEIQKCWPPSLLLRAMRHTTTVRSLPLRGRGGRRRPAHSPIGRNPGISPAPGSLSHSTRSRHRTTRRDSYAVSGLAKGPHQTPWSLSARVSRHPRASQSRSRAVDDLRTGPVRGSKTMTQSSPLCTAMAARSPLLRGLPVPARVCRSARAAGRLTTRGGMIE
jgi:hypothetical protein